MANAIKNKRIVLQEYGEPVDIQPGEINHHSLTQANKQWARALGLNRDPIQIIRLVDGRVRLRAEEVTGVVRIGDTDIEITPKFLSSTKESWQTVLWRILAVVEGGYVDDKTTTAHEVESLAMPDLLAEMFLASYSGGAIRGLPRTYQTTITSGSMLRGSIDISRVGDWLIRPWEIPYIADMLVDDTPLARLFRWTAEQLAATVKSPVRSRAVREIASALSHVGRNPPHLIDAQQIQLGIQHASLETARIVGLLLLTGSGVHHALGEHAITGFLWKSDVIYENYVYWLCKRAASKRGKKVTKASVKFGEIIYGEGSRLETTPDVVFSDAQGNTVAITDSKYKRFGTRPKATDTYQILTAGQVLGCQRVSLTYPVEEDRTPTVWKITSKQGRGDVQLTALPLNLMSLVKPDGPQHLVDAICDWLDDRN